MQIASRQIVWNEGGRGTVVDIPDTSPVDVRVYFSWYSAGGFVYLDPDIKLMGA